MDQVSRDIFQEMKSEQNRLDSFTDWTVTFIKPEDCAKTGFFFINDKDKVVLLTNFKQ